MKILHHIPLAALLCLGLTAMGQASDEGPRPALATELVDRFADTTQLFTDGVAYYSATGVLLSVRGGEKRAGQWTTDDAGTLCWVFNGEDPECVTYVLFQGLIYQSVDGHIHGQPDLQAGNMLLEAANAKAFAQSVKLFSPVETRAFLSGKTALRSEVGRMFYAPDQTLRTNWNGVQKTGTWSIDADGGVCWQVVGWGKQPCEYYFEGQDGTVWARFRGIDKIAAEHRDGDLTD
ncbi:MAG: hypothetical protein AAGC81_03340 [Pseudomonadota bacterium]